MTVLRQSEKISFVGQICYFFESVWLEANSDTPNQILLGIFRGNNLIGYCGLVHVDWVKKVAEVSFLLSQAEITRIDYGNIFFAALNALKKSGRFIGMAKLTTETYDLPERRHHIACLEEFGFEREWLVRNSDSEFASLHHGLGLG